MDCGTCTACCRDLELHEIPSKIGEPCSKCEEGVGCTIYETRPKECKEFLCVWAQMEKVGEDLRPDKCGVIFSRTSKDVMSGRVDQRRKMTQLAAKQIESFKKEGFSVVLYRGDETNIQLHKNHSLNHVMEAIRGRAELH